MSCKELSADEYFENRMVQYSNPATEFVGRKYEWFKNTDFSSKQVDVSHVEAMILGGIVGGVGGACVGAPFGGPVGAGIGFAVGVPVGIALGYAFVEGLKVRFSLDEYQEYVKTTEGKEFANRLIELYKNDEAFDKLNCRISYEPVIDGVYVKGYKQNIYERKNIEEVIDKTGKDPFTTIPISRESLIPAGEYITYQASITCVAFLKHKKMQLQQTQPQMAKGFDILIADYRNNFARIYGEKIAQLTEDKSSRLISYEEFVVFSKQLHEKYMCL